MNQDTKIKEIVIPKKFHNRINKLLSELNSSYPEKIIVFLKRDYPYLAKAVKNIRKEINFKDNEEFFLYFGFQYVDYNKINKDYYHNKNEILKVIERINLERNNLIQDSYINFEDYEEYLSPLELFYYDNSWHPIECDINITNIIQKKINYAFDKLLKYYPKRIVINLYSMHRHFIEDYLKELKVFFKVEDYSELLYLFGFIYVNKKFKKNIDKEKQDSLILSKEITFHEIDWIPQYNLKYDKSHQNIINYVFNITYALFPNRIITNLNVLFSFADYKKYLSILLKTFNMLNESELFNEFGFVLSEDLNEKIIYPEFIYSLNKEILYKIFSDKKKIPLDKNTKIIESGALSELNIETLDLSLINERSLILKSNAIVNCHKLKNIYNISAIKESSEDSIVNCNQLNSKTIVDNFNSVYDQRQLLYIIFLKDEKSNTNTFISDKLYRVGSYVKNENDDKIYLVYYVSYGSEDDFLYYPINEKYKEINSKDYPEKYIISYNLDLQTNKFSTYPTNFIAFVKSCFDYYARESDVYLSSDILQNTTLECENLLLPIYDKNKLINYEEIELKSILNTNNAKKVECIFTSKTSKFDEAILGINSFQPFMKYINFIYHPIYIKTFLKFHETNPYIFLNSSFLINDIHFLKTIFELYPDLDKRIIPKTYKDIILFDREGEKILC